MNHTRVKLSALVLSLSLLASGCTAAGVTDTAKKLTEPAAAPKLTPSASAKPTAPAASSAPTAPIEGSKQSTGLPAPSTPAASAVPGTQPGAKAQAFAKIATISGGSRGFKDGGASEALFDQPMGIALDSQGNVYVTGDYRVRKIAADGTVTTLAGLGESKFLDGPGAKAKFVNPWGIAVDSAGQVFVGDGNRIRKIAPDGTVSTFAGGDGGGDHKDGKGTEARFYNITGMTMDSGGNMYVTEGAVDNYHVRKITPDGTVSTIAGIQGSSFSCSRGKEPGNCDGPGLTAALFRTPTGIDIDSAGNLYVADSGNHRIRKITPDGMVSTLAGSEQNHADGVGKEAKFNAPQDVAVDSAGNVYVVEANGGASFIRQILPDGTTSTLVGANGSGGFADGPLASAAISSPTAIAVDKQGALYFTDSANHRIRKLN